jgi:hypothetical protein
MVLDTTWGWLTNRPGRVLNQFLTTNGEPDGPMDANGDYSTVATDFYIAPPEGVIYETLALSIYLTCTLTPGPGKYDYGEVANGLDNGVLFIFKQGTYENILNPAGNEFKNASDLVLAGARVIDTKLNGAVDALYVFRFEFLRDYARSLPLHGASDESFRVRLNDDFTDLSIHRFSVNGIRKALHRDLQL